MTEAEATSTLATIGDTMCAFIGLWVSATFAYLSVAYFVGRDLTRFQNIAVTGLYGVSATLFAFGAAVHAEAWLDIAIHGGTIYGSISTALFYPYFMPAFTLILVAGISISFYFMYNVRHTEKPDPK